MPDCVCSWSAPVGIDPEQLALGDRDQIVALVALLGRQLVVGEALRVGDRLLQPLDLGVDAGLRQVGDLAVIFVPALRRPRSPDWP